MSHNDDAREERAARLRSKIDRMTGHASDAQTDVSDDATADGGTGDASGGAPDEGTVSGGGARTGAGGKSKAEEKSSSGAAESPREFIHRKMREGGEGEKG